MRYGLTMSEHNMSGVHCPECGFRTHKAEYDGEIKYRCVTDSCEIGWFDAE